MLEKEGRATQAAPTKGTCPRIKHSPGHLRDLLLSNGKESNLPLSRAVLGIRMLLSRFLGDHPFTKEHLITIFSVSAVKR